MPEQLVIPQQDYASDLPLDRDTIFSNHKGIYKKRTEKRQTKLLKKVGFLKNFLKEDERILLISTACSPISILEQLITGWIFIYLKRSLLVFTNKRIFHIPTKKDYSYRNSIAQILYPDCNSIQIKGRKVIIEYKNGEKEKFFYLASKEKKKAKSLLQSLSLEGSPSESQKRNHLCPRCTERLQDGKYVCPNCHLAFKDKDEGKKISLIYPGGGYFYTRHPFLGISDAIVETLLIVLVVASLIDAVKGIEGSSVDTLIFLLVLVMEKAISVYHSNHFIKEYIPKEKDVQPIEGI
jgi:hypothetical protein